MNSYYTILVITFVLLSGSNATDKADDHEYCVVGAGPAGLQMGYFLHQADRDYVVFERNHQPGSFFLVYPRHDTLISINKRNTGRQNKEFNLRHDWNSLLSHDPTLLFKHYSKIMFPPKDAMLQFLKDYHQRLNINVKFNTKVGNIKKINSSDSKAEHFTMSDNHGNNYNCGVVIMANGVDLPNTVNFTGSEYVQGYEDIPLNPEDYEGQSVLILGRGNTGFEVAQAIQGNTNFVHLIGRSRARLSFSTHYVGDLRSINDGILDTYQLKSLDGLLEGPVKDLVIVKNNKNQLYALDEGTWSELKRQNYSDAEALQMSTYDGIDNSAFREPYDRVIRCLGFRWDDTAFDNSSNPGRGTFKKQKYPSILPNYESKNVSGLYFAGANTHSIDLRKSAGGFIHGFRYTTRCLHRYLEATRHGVPWTNTVLLNTDLINHVVKRINEASGLYQMFSILADIVVFNSDNKSAKHFEEYPLKYLHKFGNVTGEDTSNGVLVCVLEYGKDFSKPGADTLRSDRATLDPLRAHKSNFLHPVFYFYKTLPSSADMKKIKGNEILPTPDKLHHTVEDFLTVWNTAGGHILPLRRFLESILNAADYRSFTSQECWSMSLLSTTSNLPPYCIEHYEMSDSNGFQNIRSTDMMRNKLRDENILFF